MAKYSTGELQDWFIGKARTAAGYRKNILANDQRAADNAIIGKMYFFKYDPKGKMDLPKYDKFPMVFPIEQYQDGFLGLNLHYLPIRVRAAFLDKLMAYAVLKDDDIQKIRVTYDILNASRRFKEFKPCIKRYLKTRLRSKILTIQPNEWEVATFLPMYQFKGAKPQQVWKESLQTIKEDV